jgi:hypothetical protein
MTDGLVIEHINKSTLYRCKEGHTWTVSCSVIYTERCNISGVLKTLADSGEICPYCFCNDLRAKYGAI